METNEKNQHIDLLLGRMLAIISVIVIGFLATLSVMKNIDGASLMTAYTVIGVIAGGLARTGLRKLLK